MNAIWYGFLAAAGFFFAGSIAQILWGTHPNVSWLDIVLPLFVGAYGLTRFYESCSK